MKNTVNIIKNLSNIEKLFLNYKELYKKIHLDWDNEVGKEIWDKDENIINSLKKDVLKCKIR